MTTDKVIVIEATERSVTTDYSQSDTPELGIVKHGESCSCGDPRCPASPSVVSGGEFDARNHGW